MALLGNILGFSAVGLLSRFGQLGIQKRNLFENPGGHFIAMASFGFAGYWVYQWDQRAAVLLAEKRAQIAEARGRKTQAAAEAEAE